MANAEKFKKELDFELLKPKYSIPPEEIRDFIINQYNINF
jgi:hypothetical protein